MPYPVENKVLPCRDGGEGTGERIAMFNLCRPIMPSGAKCHAPALRGKPYCYFHTRLHKFTAAPPIEVDGNLRLGVLEDRSAIQIALQNLEPRTDIVPIPPDEPPPSITEN